MKEFDLTGILGSCLNLAMFSVYLPSIFFKLMSLFCFSMGGTLTTSPAAPRWLGGNPAFPIQQQPPKWLRIFQFLLKSRWRIILKKISLCSKDKMNAFIHFTLFFSVCLLLFASNIIILCTYIFLIINYVTSNIRIQKM